MPCASCPILAAIQALASAGGRIRPKLPVDTVSSEEQPADMGFTGGQPDMTAAQFKTTRAASGLTMAKAAELLGVSLRTVWRWEHGAVRIDRFKSERIRREMVPGLWAKSR